ncbi:hypothetical protein DCBHLPFO_00741 [Mycoplasmopsis arginini]|uniref:Uncharacterized protein n=1 Tax=Mycoplasmopsis arginini TaxID=2094 RepID=A0AA43QZY0_MYCAR|nr:hypothetical protein [Mycoplasmopsis arginini]
MRDFKFFQKDTTSSEDNLIAVFAPSLRYFRNWKNQMFLLSNIDDRSSSYFRFNGVGYKYISVEMDIVGRRFTDYEVLERPGPVKLRILNNLIRRLESNETV